VPTLHVLDPDGRSTSQWPAYMLKKRETLVHTHFPSFRMALNSGVPIAAGSDSNYDPQYGTVIDEILAEVKFGMTPQQALKSATKSGALLLGLGDELGTIGVGKEADVLAVRGNPVEDVNSLREIQGMVFRGRLLPRSTGDSKQ